jgi:hypothetical protein
MHTRPQTDLRSRFGNATSDAGVVAPVGDVRFVGLAVAVVPRPSFFFKLLSMEQGT